MCSVFTRMPGESYVGDSSNVHCVITIVEQL